MRLDAARVGVAIAKLALDPPSGTKTFAGGRRVEVSRRARVTSTPPAGAALCSVTVPVTEFPPTTAFLLRERLKRIGHRPREFCCQLKQYAARSVPTVAPRTGIVVIGEASASVEPAGIGTGS